MGLILPKKKKIEEMNLGQNKPQVVARISTRPTNSATVATFKNTPPQTVKLDPTLPYKPTPQTQIKFDPMRGLKAANPLGFAKGVGEVLQGMARIPESVYRSVMLEPLVGNATRTSEDAVNTDSAENTGVRKFLYGENPVKSYQSQARDIQMYFKGRRDQTTPIKLAQVAAPLLPPVIAALDLYTGGRGRTAKKVIESGAEAVAREAADVGAREASGLVDDATKQALEIIDKATTDAAATVKKPRATGKIGNVAVTDVRTAGEAPRPATTREAIPTNILEDTSLADMRRERRLRYEQSIPSKIRDAVGREIHDPRNVEQRLDNSWFKYLKEEGTTKKGQYQLLPEESLADIRGRIQNPHRIAGERLNTKYQTEIGDFSVNDIVKKYGGENSNKAQAFEDYRIFKDELWRISNGEKPTISKTPQYMQEYIAKYENANPDAIAHNAALRQHALTEAASKEKVGRLAPGTTDELAKNPYYTPREEAIPENVVRPKITGGTRSNIKGIERRKEFNEAPSSPLSLFRKLAVDNERAIAQQQYGLEMLRRIESGHQDYKNFRHAVDADVVTSHKQLRNDARHLSEEIKTAKQTRDKLKSMKRTIKTRAASAKRSANQAVRDQAAAKRNAQKALEDKVRKQEDAITAKVQRLIDQSKGDSEQILSDLTTRDPRYAQERAAILAQDFPGLTAAEKRAQINYELKQLEQKYPKPQTSFSKEELLEIGKAIGREVDDTMPEAATSKIASATTRRRVTRRLSNKLQQAVDDVSAMVRQSQQDLADLGVDLKDVNRGIRATQQYNEPNTNMLSYFKAGEQGKIEMPFDLANSIAKQNEQTVSSIIDHILRPISNVQKIVWTGLLNPSFQVYSTLVKNPSLMIFNADGLSGVSPKVVKSLLHQMFRTNESKWFSKEMRLRNASYENVFQSKRIDTTTTDDIARRAGIVEFIEGSWKHPIRTLGDFWKAGNAVLAALPNSQRTAVAYSAYRRALKIGFNEKEALDIASQAPSKVFGDFDRVTKLAQALEPFTPYAGATQAGNRAILRTIRTRPAEAAAKATVMMTGAAGLAAYSIHNASKYYQDMLDQGSEYKLDNNLTIALPGAHKDDNGNWSGILTIPLVPDFRPTNRAIWRTIYDIDQKQVNGATVAGRFAGELFNQLTGDIASQVYEPKKGEDNIANGILSGSPILNVGRTLAGVNTWTGEPLSDEFMASRPKTEQKNDFTSDTAVKVSEAIGGALTPFQVDQILSLGGTAGDIVQNPRETNAKFLDAFTKPFTPGRSRTEDKEAGAEWYKNVKKAAASIQDERTYREFMASKSKGSELGEADLLKNARTIQSYYTISDGKFRVSDRFKAEKYLDALQRQDGKQGNPLFDLKGDKLQKVLEYRSSKMLNQGKQSYDKDGNSLFMSLGLDEKWYRDFQDKESDYWDGVKKDLKNSIKTLGGEDKKKARTQLDALTSNDPKTFSGAKRPQLTDAQEKQMDFYYSLPKGTGDRSAYLEANPWIVDYWNASDGFVRRERDLLGLKNADVLNDGSSGSYYKSGGGYGGGYGYYGGSGSKNKVLNSRQYAISPTAGGTVSKPKVTARTKSIVGGKAYTARKRTVKAPKVTIKKSMV